VFAIPGSIHSPVARGCHRLIKDGAKLVESVDDVLAELGLGRPASTPDAKQRALRETALSESLENSDRSLLAVLDFAPAAPETLVAASGLSASEAAGALARLELAGLLERLPDGQVRRRPG
jgi:DNA processing protein